MKRCGRLAFCTAIIAGAVAITSTRAASADEETGFRRPEPPVVVYAPPPPLAAPDPPRPEPRDPNELTLSNGSLELTVAGLMFAPSLRNVAFDGHGTPLGSEDRVHFRHTGVQLGLDHPAFWGGELQAHYIRRYFAIGVTGYYVAHAGGGDATPVPPRNVAATQVNPGSLSAYGGGIDVSGAIPIGEYIALRPGAVVGVRGFTMDLTGFQKTTCTTKTGTIPCWETATSDPLLVVEPRLTIQLTPTPHGELFFGGFIGTNLVDGSMSGGIFVGVHTPHSALWP
jgi:hypothetical protein